jgi:hypothetical protein
MRTPVFELHIRPMMRALDRDQMLGQAIDLWDYDNVVARAQDILDRVSQSRDMPPITHGGPWPEEWAQVFGRWVATGFKRLLLGTTSALSTWSEAGGVSTLRVTTLLPSAAHIAWLDLEEITETTRRYALVIEPPDVPDGSAPMTKNLRERYGSPQPHSVFLRDSSGILQVH